MQKTTTKKGFASLRPFRWAHLVALGVILVFCIGLFGWGGATFLPDAADTSRREIVNDDYTEITQPLTAEDTLKQSLYVEGRLYGVVLNVATFNRVVHGTLHLRLMDVAGATIATSDTDMSTLLDNTFHRFLFDGLVEAGGGSEYTLAITASPATPEDTLGFWKSTGVPASFVAEGETLPHYDLSQGQFGLRLNGEAEAGTLALQYTTQYAGRFILRGFAFFAALITAVLLLLYGCLFILKVPLHKTFLLAVIGLGSVFIFLIPPRTAPDEYAHISTAYHYSNLLLGQPEVGEPGTLTVRAGDEMMLHNYDYNATNIFAYQAVAEGVSATAPKGEPVAIPARVVSVFPLLYAAPTLGVVAARLLGLSQAWLLLLGRFANLLLFAVVGSRAIKRMPLAKPMLFVVGILPMTLQLAASFCYDTYLLALAFYFTAVVLQYTYEREKVGLLQVVWLGVLVVLIAPAKTIYLVLVALIFILPKEKFASKRSRWFSQGGVLAVALLVWGFFNLAFVRGAAGSGVSVAATEAATSLAANGDSRYYFNFRYILGNIPQTVNLLLLSLWQQGPLWLQGLLGGRLGEIIAITIEVNWLFVVGMLVVILLAALPDDTDNHLLRTPHRWLFGAVALAVAGLFTLACITWTPINYTTIFGIQGRYFLPVLPLALLALRGKNLRFVKPAGSQLIFSMAALVVLCQLDAFFIILGRG